MKLFILLALCQLMPLLREPLPAAGPHPEPKKEPAVLVYTAYENPSMLYIRCDNPQLRNVTVSLLSERNDKLGFWRSRRHQFNLRLDVSDLPDGSYRVRVTGPEGNFVRTLHLGTRYQRTQRTVALTDPGLAAATH
ncbi:MAG: hypothetical protein ICV83_04885 [Cytophagales bacterium]|nr:hypothetical protein [Cytophagales bacterium]